jgi:hypothetical protein
MRGVVQDNAGMHTKAKWMVITIAVSVNTLPSRGIYMGGLPTMSLAIHLAAPEAEPALSIDHLTRNDLSQWQH